MKSLLTMLATRIIKRGNFEIEFADGARRRFGDASGAPVAARFTDKRGPFELVRNPELMLGELFMDGRLQMMQGSILDFLHIIMSNAVRRAPPLPLRAIWTARHAASKLVRNERSRARRNVAHHYDLDAKLYDLFLDVDRQYSCAYFERPDMSLDEAQLAKKRHIAAKLLIEPGHRTLDIGSGWGGMAFYLARHCGADVTGVTLSTEQLSMAQTRAQTEGLEQSVRFHLQDYRDVKGPFDRIVSVGMFEHVGAAHYDAFFAKIAGQLNEDGLALVHTIGRPDGPGATNAWITKYIFPGGHIPSLSQIVASAEKAGLFITDVEILRLHYAETLKVWRERFLARRDEALALYDERFCRKWEFYLSLTELAFRVEGECVFQIQFARRHDRIPVTRDYMFEREALLREKDRDDLAPQLRTAAQ
ncbi:MAG: class I SAM-dependent methyltransferase [Rhodoblastus sp.]